MAKKFSIKKLAAGVLAALMVVTALPVSGLTASVSKAADDTVSVYRSYNPNSGEHFMTITKAEHDSVVAAGRSDEGVAWTAPASSKTPVYRSYNPNSGEHLLVPQEEAEWLVTQGWNNEGLKMYSDDGEGVAIYRVYNPNAKDAGAHLYTANKAEADYLVGLGWTYDNNGKPLLYGVSTSEDKKGEITLSDISGLQSDGTGLVSDVLNVSYGSDLGAPQTITWYYNNTVVKAYTNQQGDLTNGLYLVTENGTAYNNIQPLSNCKDGEYYVVIVNTKGETFKSNTIELVYDEIPAEVSNFEITDDYVGAGNIVAANADTKAVISVTLNKDYKGKFYIYEDSVEKFTTGGAIATVDNSTGSYFTGVKTASKLAEVYAIGAETAAQALTSPAHAGIKYTYENGKTTYMFQVPTGDSLKRGTEYKLAFDQTGIYTDDISTTGRTDIETTDSYLCDYLAGPKAISVVQAAAGSPAYVALLDEEGPLSYLSAASLANAGFDSIIVYSNGSAKTDGASAEVASGGAVYEGVYVSSAAVTNGSGKYYFAVAKTTAGVFGEKSETLTSGFKAGNVAIAEKVSISEDSTVASQANISLVGLAADATVYIYNTSDSGYVANSNRFDASLSSTYRGKVDVTAGQGDATISNIFTKNDFATGNDFYAIVIPKNQDTYAEIYNGAATGTAASPTAFNLSETPTSVQVSEEGIRADYDTNDVTIKGLIAYNQFGEKMTSQVTQARTAAVTPIDSNAASHENGSAKWAIPATNGRVVLDVEDDGTSGVDNGDGFTVSLLGSTIKVTQENGSGTAFVNGKVKVVIDGTTYVDGTSNGAAIVLSLTTTSMTATAGTALASENTSKVVNQYGEEVSGTYTFNLDGSTTSVGKYDGSATEPKIGTATGTATITIETVTATAAGTYTIHVYNHAAGSVTEDNEVGTITLTVNPAAGA